MPNSDSMDKFLLLFFSYLNRDFHDKTSLRKMGYNLGTFPYVDERFLHEKIREDFLKNHKYKL